MLPSRSSAVLLVALLVACGPQVVLDFEDTDDSGAADGSTSGPPSTSSSASSTISTTMMGPPDPSLDDGATLQDDGSPTAGPGEPMVCTHTCVTAADCTYQGQDYGAECRDGVCFADEFSCATADECIPILSGWTSQPCTEGGGECENLGMVCVDVGRGIGGCAQQPGISYTCAGLGWDETLAFALDARELIVVCGETDGLCHARDGYCYLPCTGDDACGPFTCNMGTGLCECTTDEQCADIGVPSWTCIDGSCVDTCTVDSDCENIFDGGFVTCGP